MIRLGVNVDHVATVRQARKVEAPDPVEAALLAEKADADGITVQGPDGALLYANDAAVRAIGFETSDQLLGAPIADVMWS